MEIDTETSYRITLSQNDMGLLHQLVEAGRRELSESLSSNEEWDFVREFADRVLGAI